MLMKFHVVCMSVTPHPHVDQRTEFHVTSCECYAIGQHPSVHF